jgi:osmotically-inducible protein OsmY
MRYKYFSALFSTAALAGALTLSAAPQANNPEYQDPELSYMDQQPVTTTTMTTVQTSTRSDLSDHQIRRQMHKAIFHDVTMSNRARNVRVIARNGQVTLKGSVPTTMEKEKIEAKATELVGSGNVTDQIKVKHHNFIG